MKTEMKDFNSLFELLEAFSQKGASPKDMAIAMEQFVEYKARNNGIPMRGTLELTPICNLNCKMCYVHLSDQQMEYQLSNVMTAEQWIYIIKQAIDAGLFEATLTGGEALMHPEFDKIFLFLIKNNIRVKLKTNGLLLSEKKVELLKNNYLSGIQISLYGYDEDSYERVTGKRAFRVCLDAIERVRKANIPLEIVVTPSKYIWENIEELLRFVDSMGVQYTVNSGLIEPFEETGRAGQKHDLSLEQYIELSKMRARICGVQLTPSCIEDFPQTGGSNVMEAKGLRCAAGRSVFAVTWRGRILPCRSIENIGFDGLSVPFSEGWKEIFKAVCSYPIPRECIGCQYERVCPNCVVQHAMGAEIGHANKAFCKKARRLAEEGLIKKNIT